MSILKRAHIGLIVLSTLVIPAAAKDVVPASVEINKRSVPRKSEAVKPKSQSFELRGYLNTQPVYLILEKAGGRQVVGYLFDSKGRQQYVYGEWIKDQLQLYDTAKTRLNVILNQ